MTDAAISAGLPARETEPTCDISVLILSFNEERHIERAIASVRGVARKVFVVDSFSKDRTVELATRAGATVLEHAYVSYSPQFNWGLDNAGIDTEWTMRLDADEIIEPDLVEEIRRRLPTLPDDVVAVNFDRKHVFMGKWVKHGGRYPLRMIRLWRTGKGRVEERWMDEHVVPTVPGRVVTFKGGYADINENDLGFFTAKHNGYATREALDVLVSKYGLLPAHANAKPELSSRQAQVKRWFKVNVYNRLPLWAGPLGYFLYRYFLQLGFLDGKEGTIYHVLQGFWYRYLVACKIFEFERGMAHCTSTDDRRDTLARLTGFKIEPPTADYTG